MIRPRKGSKKWRIRYEWNHWGRKMLKFPFTPLNEARPMEMRILWKILCFETLRLSSFWNKCFRYLWEFQKVFKSLNLDRKQNVLCVANSRLQNLKNPSSNHLSYVNLFNSKSLISFSVFIEIQLNENKSRIFDVKQTYNILIKLTNIALGCLVFQVDFWMKNDCMEF